jgi:regulator of sigma E protease
VSYVLAFLGFAALIILHEFGHFVAAKAVGMRVERFSLFFGPLLVKVRRGETEYGVGPIPLGGYVRITGMNPNEEIPPEVLPRAYYNQPVWKRVVVILAGPAMNLLIAFGIVWALFLSNGQAVITHRVAAVEKGTPAASALHVGDQVVSVDGVRGSADAIRNQIDRHRCAGAQVAGCKAATPATIVVRRDHQLVTFKLRPQYNASDRRVLLGFEFGSRQAAVGPAKAASLTVSQLWTVTKQTVSVIARIFQPKARSQLHGVVGGYTITEKSFATSTTLALYVLALISLSLAVINLFPFLPLDGGHVFWALAEKVRGKRIPFAVMERAGAVGFVLIIIVFVIGLSNDISTLSGPGFNLSR